jgi:hypothetical protein
MKKILAIAVAFMYFAITSGLVLQIHYCMGRQAGASVGLTNSSDHSCVKCGMQNGKNKCCHDEIKFLKLQDVHQQVSADFFVPPPAVIEQAFNLIAVPELDAVTVVTPASHSPPPHTGQTPLFILHGVFRI